MNTLAHRSLLAVIGGFFALSSIAAPPAQEENTTQAKLGVVTWEIRYDSKKDDGVLVRAKGRIIEGPADKKGMLFVSGECTIQNDSLTLGKGFTVTKGNNVTASTEPQTRAILKSNGNFQLQGGRAKTRIVQE